MEITREKMEELGTAVSEDTRAYQAQAQTGELSDGELNAVVGGTARMQGPSVIQTPYLATQPQPAVELLPMSPGGAVTVQPLPYNGQKIETASVTSDKTFSI